MAEIPPAAAELQTQRQRQRQERVLKPREIRHLRAREIRRTLADIAPANSLSQTQCPLFAVLPGEIRFHIFTLALSQTSDASRRVDADPFNPIHRLGHTCGTTVDIPLLLTCRLIYYEARAIPLRSATHHTQSLWNPPGVVWDNWLFHISKQRGQEMYHLHDTVISTCLEDFSKYLLCHLKWRRVTWTVCGVFEHFQLAEQEKLESLADTLTGLRLPESCEEVNLELEMRQSPQHDSAKLLEYAKACRDISLERRNNSNLEFDDRYAVQYKWHIRPVSACLGQGDDLLHNQALLASQDCEAGIHELRSSRLPESQASLRD